MQKKKLENAKLFKILQIVFRITIEKGLDKDGREK